ncbi:hydrolase [Anaerostipes sp. 992a]|uniref:3'-5' exoribonuclease YhaM family protein n=1 Tax=Anaerostipes sp. 992a TaxID=1261637 RepID=UPI0009518A3A|nr:HD domain-containing protein [Anaerostipes sp. 992a]MDD5969125.1 HD domain-containing protein [Anaerostipes sp.]OLR60954.1 hydrolase [Anaerostipes sp. 992a]
MRLIAEMREGDMISDVYLCKSKQILKTKMGKSYYALLLQDRTGTLDAKIWELNNAIGHFESMDYIRVEGQITVFQGANQLNIRRVRKAEEGEYTPSDYMPCTDKDVKKLYKELQEMIQRTKNPYLKKLAEVVFVEDKAFVKEFVQHSAAKSVHHGFMGGLLEHTVSVARMCEYYCTQYTELNRDLLVMCALFHDIGKVEELSAFPYNDYTDEGQLVGHIVMGTIKLDRIMQTIPGFPVKLGNEVKHCILAHHGELEYGSPKKPALMEALALSLADNTDAKLQTFREALKKENTTDSEWMGYQRLFESNIRPTSK